MTEKVSIDQIWDTIMKSHPAEGWLMLDKGETVYAILKSDVNLRIEVTDSPDNEPFEEVWVSSFPDENARQVMCEVAYSASPLQYLILVRVDGGRAILPGTTDPSPLEWRIARIINQDNETFFECAKQAGFKVSTFEQIERRYQNARKKIMDGLKLNKT